MSIVDKLERFSEESLKAAIFFVDSMSSEIRDEARAAVTDGIADPLVWLVNCRDEAGLRLAQEWKVPEVVDGRRVEEMPYCLIRPVSFEKARAAFARMPIDLTIPNPRKEQIDVLAVTAGSIFVVGLPRDPMNRDLYPKPGELVAVLSESLSKPSQELLLQAIVDPVEKSKEGQLIRAIAIPWLKIAKEIERDPNFLFHFAQNPRKFEEFIAATYAQEGWTDVILTPRSGDHGRDVIATKAGIGSIRFLDQCKAYSRGRLVRHEDVRAMYGVLNLYPNSSKAIITTTSDFQPGIMNSDEFKAVMPHRLELRNGVALREWLQRIVASDSTFK